MKFILLTFFIQITFIAYSNDKNKVYELPGPHLALGFSNRLCQAQTGDIKLRYVNVGSKANDTFNYDDHLNAFSNLITFNFGISGTYKFVGAKLDIGVVPFANRNYNINLLAFTLIPLHENVTLSAEFGYTRLRKKRILGTLHDMDEEYIELNEFKYSYLTIMTHQVSHSYVFGLGAYVYLGSDYYLYLNSRYHNIIRQRNSLKVAARDEEDPFLFESITYDASHRFGLDDQNVQIKNAQGQNVSRFCNPGIWSFTAQLCIPLGDLEGQPYSPKKFMGAQ